MMHRSNMIRKKSYTGRNDPIKGGKYHLLMKKLISVTAMN